MNFKENYQREMNEIEKPADITEQVLNAADMEQEIYAAKKNRSGAIWKTAVATIALVCVLGLCLQHENVSSFARSVLNRYTVSVNDEKMEFGKIEPIKIDIEALTKDGNIEYFQDFTSYQEMNQLTQIELPCADKVEYKEIWVHILPQYKNGHIGADFLYQGTLYGINGMFTLEGFDQEVWGYGDNGSKEIYHYGDGKTACFIKNKDGRDVVYFQEGNILFQLYFGYCYDPDCEDETCTLDHHITSKKEVKKLLKLFGREN